MKTESGVKVIKIHGNELQVITTSINFIEEIQLICIVYGNSYLIDFVVLIPNPLFAFNSLHRNRLGTYSIKPRAYILNLKVTHILNDVL